MDDVEVMRTMMSRILTVLYHDTCEIRTANDGEQGAQLIEEYEPDLVFTDLTMPRKNGVYVINKAKEKNIPVVLMTTNDPKDEIYQEAVKAGPNNILSKPFVVADIITVVETVFNPNQNLEGNL